MEAEIEVGGACRVKQGRKLYNGKIAAIGKRIVGQAKYCLPPPPKTVPNLIGHCLRRDL